MYNSFMPDERLTNARQADQLASEESIEAIIRKRTLEGRFAPPIAHIRVIRLCLECSL